MKAGDKVVAVRSEYPGGAGKFLFRVGTVRGIGREVCVEFDKECLDAAKCYYRPEDVVVVSASTEPTFVAVARQRAMDAIGAAAKRATLGPAAEAMSALLSYVDAVGTYAPASAPGTGEGGA